MQQAPPGRHYCAECRMYFETADQLKNHKRKFCSNSAYANPESLDEIYRTQQLAQKMSDVNHLVDKNLTMHNITGTAVGLPAQGAGTQSKPSLAMAGQQSLQDLRVQLRNQEQALYDLKQKRNQTMQQKESGQDEDEFLQEIIYLKNDMELSLKSDQQRIRQAVQKIEDLNIAGEDRRMLVSRLQKLNALLREREALREAEMALVRDFEQLQIDKLQYLQRLQIAGERRNGAEKLKTDEETLRLLKNRKLLLEKEREKILQQVELVEKSKEFPVPNIVRMDENSGGPLQATPTMGGNKADYPQRVEYNPDQDNLQKYYKNAQQFVVQEKPVMPVRQPLYQAADQFLQQQPQAYQDQPDYAQEKGYPLPYNPPTPVMQWEAQNIVASTEDPNNPFSMFSGKKEFFVQNGAINAQLDNEERFLMNLNREEVDELRILSKLPVGTELYRFKLEQYKEAATIKAEIEKLVLEQKLQKVRRNYEVRRREEDREVENQKWVDDQRKYIISSKMQEEEQ